MNDYIEMIQGPFKGESVPPNRRGDFYMVLYRYDMELIKEEPDDAKLWFANAKEDLHNAIISHKMHIIQKYCL